MLTPNNMSAWEMLLTYARAFSVTVASVEVCRGRVHGLMMAGLHDPISADDAVGAGTLEALDAISTLCGDIPSLQAVCFQIERIERQIKQQIDPLVLYTNLENLNLRIMDELREHYYYPITEINAKLYDNEQPFGKDVFDVFPSARSDIHCAVRCMILGQPTAAVFHSMRVMEVGLRVLSRKLGIPYAPSWESHLKQIAAKVSEKHANKTRGWNKFQPLFLDLSGDLTSVKFAWRNPTMHIVRDYDATEARTIVMAVQIFMNRMATHGFKESGKPIAARIAIAAE